MGGTEEGPGPRTANCAAGCSSQGPPASVSGFPLAEGSPLSSSFCLSHILLWKQRSAGALRAPGKAGEPGNLVVPTGPVSPS